MSEESRLDVGKLQGELLPAVLSAARTVASLCGEGSSEDLPYYQAVYADVVCDQLASTKSRLLSLFQSITRLEGCQSTPTSVEDYEETTRDVLEGMLEICDTQLDIAYGRIKEPKIAVSHVPKKRQAFQTAPAHLNVIKPHDVSIYESSEHPYAKLLRSLTFERYSKLDEEPLKTWKPLEETPLLWIDNEASFELMLKDLFMQSMIAVDLEHHSMHSYHGFTCLMQISTLEKDYLIDTIRLRNAIPRLAPIFANPDVLKIMHGAESDNAWLQRDFNIFIVGLFDTFFAAKALNFERFSFAYILERYTGIVADKAHQMSDWRIRPLPEDMQLYARQDTHYLFHIFERMREELMKADGALEGTFRRSAAQCAKLFAVEKPGPNAWRDVINRSTAPFNKVELARVKSIYEWRDRIAKQEDVSLHALMPNPVIIKLAQASESADIGSILNKSYFDLTLAIKNIDTLLLAIREASTQQKNNKQQPLKPVEPASKPEHIIFKDDDEGDAPVKRVAIATELKPSKRTKRTGSSMASVFASSAPANAVPDIKPVIANLDISKVERATAALNTKIENRQAEQASENPEEEEAVIKPLVKEAVILKTGESFTEEELLGRTAEKREFSFSSKKTRTAQQPIALFDYSAAQQQPVKSETAETDVKIEPYEFKPTFETVTFTKSEASAQRLPTQPRSGNRQQTFYN